MTWPRAQIQTLASGARARVLIMRPRECTVDPGYRGTPDLAELCTSEILAEARLGKRVSPVPGPFDPLPEPEQNLHPGVGTIDVFSHRGKATLKAVGTPLAPLFLLRTRAASLDTETVIANCAYFHFTGPDLSAPWDAIGDPVGLVMTAGEVDFPPQLPRACLLTQGPEAAIAPIGFDQVDILLPSGQAVRAHPFGQPSQFGPGTAFARFFGSEKGLSPKGAGYDVAYVGRFPVAGHPAGGMPIPRAGCVIRFPDRDAALAALGPLRFQIDGGWQDGVQAGPTLLREGKFTIKDDVIAAEHMQKNPALPDTGSVAPADWCSDWDHTRCARLGAGTDAQGALVIVAIEGSSILAEGGTLRDLAILLQEAGVQDALNMDGGGSTQVFGQAGGAIIAPSDAHFGLNERDAQYDRPVPNWLRLRLGE